MMSLLAMVISLPLLMGLICWHARQLEWQWRDTRESCWNGLLHWGCWSGILGMINTAWLSVVPYIVAVAIMPYVIYRMEPQHAIRLFEKLLSKLPLMNPGRAKKLMTMIGLSSEPPASATPGGIPPVRQHALPEAIPPPHLPKADSNWGETRYIGEDPSPA
jgi:hypothetical protein